MALRDYKEYSKIVDRISKAILSGKLSHAYIIEGDSMSKKDEFARDFAKAILCKEAPGTGCDICSICRRVQGESYEDLYEIMPEGQSVKDKQVQGVQKNLITLPSGEGRRNIAIIHDADTMTVRAQNRFLKTLEEPTEGTVIMLLASNSERLIPTVRSRCITIQLFSQEKEMDEKEYAFGINLIKMIYGRNYFYEIIKTMEPYTKDEKMAVKLLDSLERYMRNCMVEGPKNSGIDKRMAYRNVKYIEEARKDLRYNVPARYALRNLVVKIGGRNEEGSRS